MALGDVESGRVVRRLQGHHDEIYSLTFSPDGRSLATLGVDGELRLWNLDDGTSTGRWTGHVERSWCVTYSPDGRRLVTTGREGTVRLWDVDSQSWLTRACTIANRNLTREEWDDYIGDLADYRATCPEFDVATT